MDDEISVNAVKYRTAALSVIGKVQSKIGAQSVDDNDLIRINDLLLFETMVLWLYVSH